MSLIGLSIQILWLVLGILSAVAGIGPFSHSSRLSWHTYPAWTGANMRTVQLV